jgi:alpha-beta hydrolase superfamily lysophospholipase
VTASIEADFQGSEGRIFYRSWQPDAPACRLVVIVHGYAEHSARYAHVAEALAAEGSAIYAEDHLGHGHSDGDRALISDFEHVVDDLETLAGIAAAEHPGCPLVFMGHSMGGLLASRYAQRHPEDLAGLVLLGAVIGDWTWARDVLRQPAMPDPPTDWSGMSRDPETVRQYSTDPLVYRGRYKRPLLEAEVVALDRFNAEIERITMPVLFLHGHADPFVWYRTSLEAACRFPTSDLTIRVFPGARHELVNETNRAEVIAEIARFVGRVATAAG